MTGEVLSGPAAPRPGLGIYTVVAYGRLAAHPETEAVKDVWDLGVFGAVGPLSFVGSTTNHGTVSTQTLGSDTLRRCGRPKRWPDDQ